MTRSPSSPRRPPPPPWRAVVFRPVMADWELEVSREDVLRAVVHAECPACGGTGVAFWHPAFPDREPRPEDREGRFGCVECSTRGTVPVSVA